MIEPTLTQIFKATEILSPYVIDGDYGGDTTVIFGMEGLDLIVDLDGIEYRIQEDGALVDAAGNTGGAR